MILNYRYIEKSKCAEKNGTDYYPHGSVLPGRNSNNNLYRFGYQGQEQDAQTGYTRFDLRQFNALLGRWSTPDPMGQYHSAYLAMGNNPVSRIDPTGGEDYENSNEFKFIQRELRKANASRSFAYNNSVRTQEDFYAHLERGGDMSNFNHSGKQSFVTVNGVLAADATNPYQAEKIIKTYGLYYNNNYQAWGYYNNDRAISGGVQTDFNPVINNYSEIRQGTKRYNSPVVNNREEKKSIEQYINIGFDYIEQSFEGTINTVVTIGSAFFSPVINQINVIAHEGINFEEANDRSLYITSPQTFENWSLKSKHYSNNNMSLDDGKLLMRSTTEFIISTMPSINMPGSSNDGINTIFDYTIKETGQYGINTTIDKY